MFQLRALVVVTRYLGDVLLATPLARALATAGYEVAWLVAPGTEAVLASQPFAREVHTLNPSLGVLREAVQRLRGRFAIACVITGSDRATAVARLVADKVYALLPTRWQDGWKRAMVTRWITHDAHSHMVYYNHDLCRLAGIAPSHAAPALEWSSDDETTVRKYLGWDEQVRFAQLHPFARWNYKLWPDAHWRQLIERLHETGLHVVITAGPAEASRARALIEDTGLDATRTRILAGTLNWAQLAALSARSTLYVGLDTANTHLAAGCGAPVVALYGPTDPRIWGPWPKNWNHGRSPYRPRAGGIQHANNVTLIQRRDVGCLPCQKEGCAHHRESDSDCLSTLPVEMVWQACVQAIEP